MTEKPQAVVTRQDMDLLYLLMCRGASEWAELIAAYREEIEAQTIKAERERAVESGATLVREAIKDALAQAKREAEARFGRFVAACPCKCHDSTPHNSCADCVREAKRERDFEWWQALCLVDAVAPEPEAVKQFIVGLHDEAKREGIEQAAHWVSKQWAMHSCYTAEELAQAIRALAAEPEVKP